MKKDGIREPFNREKIKAGLQKACWKRPIGDERIELTPAQAQGFSAQNQIQNIESRFKQADEDNNEYLDNREAQRYGMGGLMALDADGDGKLYMRWSG